MRAQMDEFRSNQTGLGYSVSADDMPYTTGITE